MNPTNKKMRTYLPILLAVIIASVTLRSAALLRDFNPITNYFDSKALINAAAIVCAVGSLILFTSAFALPKAAKLIASFSTPATYIPTGAVCTALAIFAVYEFLNLRKLGDNFSVKDMATATLTLSVVLSIFSILYFILTAILQKRASQYRAGFGLANVVFLSAYASYLYFETSLSMNAPNKIVDQMAFLFAALFFLYEVRISLSREVWNFYISFGFIAAALTAYSSIPSLIVYFSDDTVVSNSIYESLLCFCIFIFILCRLVLASMLREDKHIELVEVISLRSEDMKKASEENEKLALLAYEEAFGAPSSEPEVEKEETKAVDPAIDDEDLIELTSSDEIIAAEDENISDEKINEANSEFKEEVSNAEEEAGDDDDIPTETL